MYQYSISFLHAVRELDLDDDVMVFAPSQDAVPDDLQDGSFKVVTLPVLDRLGAARRMLGRVLPPAVVTRIARLLKSARGNAAEAGRSGVMSDSAAWREWFSQYKLDLLVFTVENDIAFATGIPFVVSIHDLQHKLQPDLPEFAEESDWERREYRMRNAIAGATLVLVDSETGKEDVLNCYGDTGVEPDAVMPLPSAPAHYLRGVPSTDERRAVARRYSLPNDYLFYPAQFWPHKNHNRIVEALGMLAREGMRPHLVLAGSKAGSLRERTYAEMMETAIALGVSEQIRYLGYVPDEDMAALYAGAGALVMPTFFGPTNIPVIEAWHFDLPVITSDLRGIREQVEDAAVLVDPESSASIAEGIRRVLEDTALRTELVASGHKQLAAYTHEDYLARVAQVLSEAKQRIEAARAREGGER
jgi:glycosyltransferase involved in cell wall biosynthesis